MVNFDDQRTLPRAGIPEFRDQRRPGLNCKSMDVKHQEVSASSPQTASPGGPWYRGATSEQWRALLAAMLGWMLDSFDFVIYLMAITTLQQEFKFGKETAGLLASVALFTSAAGGLVFGVLADRLGRVRALMATILIYSLCSLGTATSQNLAQLIVWRAVLGLGMGGEWSSGAVLVSEIGRAEHRGKAIGMGHRIYIGGSSGCRNIAHARLAVVVCRWSPSRSAGSLGPERRARTG